jgi:hypothetical protein
MIIVDSSFYYSEYNGNLIPEEEVERALEGATWDIFNLINKIDGLTPFQEKCVKMAICAQADVNKTNDTGINGLASFSLGDMSVTIDNSKKTRMDKTVRRYLLRSNLINRCIL